MYKEKETCKFKGDLKGCALKHIGEARKLISKGRFQDANVELRFERRINPFSYTLGTKVQILTAQAQER